MSYFALIPKEEITEDFNPTTASRKNWLSLTEADQLICNHFNVVPDPKYYYKNWKDFLYYSQCKGTINEFMGIYEDWIKFDTPIKYIRLVIMTEISCYFIRYGKIPNFEEKLDYKKEYLEILQVIYDNGYVLVGVLDSN